FPNIWILFCNYFLLLVSRSKFRLLPYCLFMLASSHQTRSQPNALTLSWAVLSLACCLLHRTYFHRFYSPSPCGCYLRLGCSSDAVSIKPIRRVNEKASRKSRK